MKEQIQTILLEKYDADLKRIRERVLESIQADICPIAVSIYSLENQDGFWIALKASDLNELNWRYEKYTSSLSFDWSDFEPSETLSSPDDF